MCRQRKVIGLLVSPPRCGGRNCTIGIRVHGHLRSTRVLGCEHNQHCPPRAQQQQQQHGYASRNVQQNLGNPGNCLGRLFPYGSIRDEFSDQPAKAVNSFLIRRFSRQYSPVAAAASTADYASPLIAQSSASRTEYGSWVAEKSNGLRTLSKESTCLSQQRFNLNLQTVSNWKHSYRSFSSKISCAWESIENSREEIVQEKYAKSEDDYIETRGGSSEDSNIARLNEDREVSVKDTGFNSIVDEQGSNSAGKGFPGDNSDNKVSEASAESESSSDCKGDGVKIVEKERLTVPELEGFLKHMDAAFAADDPRIGVVSLRLGQEHDLHGGSPHKILAYANRALKILGKDSKDTIEVGMCLHLIGSAYYKMGKYDTCLANLSRALQIISAKEEEGQDCGALKFAVYFLLGDTMTAMGKHDDALGHYKLGLSIQEELLESGHPQLAYNCRRVAEAFTQVVRFEEALPLCQKALQIHSGYHCDCSMEEASDRRLLAVIYRGLEVHEKALQEHKLVKDILTSKGKTCEVDMVDIAIADSYISLQRYDDAVAVLESVISRLEETSPLRGLAHVNLAKTYLLQQRLDNARQECERGLEIFSNSRTEEANLLTIAEGFTELASIFEGMRETEQAIELLEQALSLYQKIPGHLNAVAGTQAQIGMLLYFSKKVQEALPYMEDAASKLQASFGDDHPTLALVLNQMGLANLELKRFPLAAELFEKCKHILSASYGAGHADTLAIFHNLVNVYSCLGRHDMALNCQRHILEELKSQGESDDKLVIEAEHKLNELLVRANKAEDKQVAADESADAPTA